MSKRTPGVQRPDFREVRPTEDEKAGWRRKNRSERRGMPYRAEHLPCGKRIWYTGLAIGSHLRACPALKSVPAEEPVELQFTGTVGTATYTDHIATAENYARYAAAAMTAGTADDTEFIADGATVTAYVHGLAHMSAAFKLDEGRPYPGDDVQLATGTCEFCRDDDVALPALLSADSDQRVCATCHGDPRIPTFDASALDDDRPVWTLTRGDLARLAGRVVTDVEAATIERALGYSTIMEAVNGAVEQVCGFPEEYEPDDGSDDPGLHP